ncbi:patatin-like phospholipase family protein [Parashewanella curva]|uniref:Patatin-like phospholipase family protein n=1 Tax=Parashewanella curva TaxID=2338552 RepID=A0A3L8PVC9_9GAMM|nr:patatin-like phospholipase family protein [Parashewanella curva]RLV59274.1 patatin-like phospholipase family protein [Parashewanella curva]
MALTLPVLARTAFQPLARASRSINATTYSVNCHEYKINGLVPKRSCFQSAKYFELTRPSFMENNEAPNPTPISKNKLAFDSLVLSGAGAKAAGFAGLLTELESNCGLKSIKHMVGTSVGSIVLFALSLGLPVHTIHQWMATSGAKFDAEVMKNKLTCIATHAFEPYLDPISVYLQQNHEPLIDQHGNEFDGTNGTACLANLTFRQHQLLVDAYTKANGTEILPNKLTALTIIASLNGKYEIEFSADNTPQIPIITAAIASSSMPRYMPAVELSSSKFKWLPPVKISSAIKVVDGGLTNNTPHIYAKGEKKLVVTPFAEKTLIPHGETALSAISEELKLAVTSLVSGINTSRVMRLNRFDARMGLSDPSVNLFFLKVNVSFKDFKGGLQRFDQLASDSAKQTKQYLAKVRKTHAHRETRNKSMNKREYINQKYHFK